MTSTRRQFIKKTSSALGGLAVLPSIPSAFGIINKPAYSDQIIGHGDFKFRVHLDWGNLDPAKTPVNNCHEMVMDSKGRLIMVGDEIKNNILIYDKSGKLLDSWGINYYGGHGLSIWNDGEEDFLFITDTKGAVIKTTLYGRSWTNPAPMSGAEISVRYATRAGELVISPTSCSRSVGSNDEKSDPSNSTSSLPTWAACCAGSSMRTSSSRLISIRP